MLEKVIKLQSALELSLEQISQEPDEVLRNSRSVEVIKKSTKEFLDLIRSYEFPSATDEVSYFKVYAPFFLCKYFYHSKLLELEAIKRNSTVDYRRRELKKELEKIDNFTNNNKDFLEKYYSATVDQDERLFTRAKNPDNYILHDFVPEISANFPKCTRLIATMLANEKIRLYIDNELLEMDTPTMIANVSIRDFRWVGASKNAAWELLNRLSERKIIFYKDAPADKKRMAEFAKLALGLEYGNIYEVDRKNRTRKKDQFPFIRSLLDDAAGISGSSAADA